MGKPLQKNGPSSSQSSIFGTGKKRDEQSFVKAKGQASDTATTTAAKEPTKPTQATWAKNGDNKATTTTTNTKPSTTNKHTTRARKGTTNTKPSSYSKDPSKKYESNTNNNNTNTATNGSSTMKKNKRSTKKAILEKEDGWSETAPSSTINNPVVVKKVEPPINDETVKKSKAKNKINEAKNHFAALGFDDDDSSEN